MLQFLSQQTILFYTMALICAWGVISQVVLRSMYGNLLRDVRRQGMAKGKFMKQLRQRYQNVCRMKQNTVNAFNTEAFIRKNLLEYRLFGGSLHTWKRMAQMAAILCAALGAVGWYISQPQAVGGMRQTYLTGTLLMEGISLLVFGVLDTGFAKQSLEITLQDELDNVLVLHASSGVQAAKSSVARQKQPEPVQPILAEFSKPANQVEMAKCNASSEEVAASAESEDISGHFGKMVSMPGRKKKNVKNSKDGIRDKQELKENLGKIREGIRETAAAADTPKEQTAKILRQMDSDEQERAIREVLKELLS